MCSIDMCNKMCKGLGIIRHPKDCYNSGGSVDGSGRLERHATLLVLGDDWKTSMFFFHFFKISLMLKMPLKISFLG